jgi:periplasmic glucans biosynthesis protein
VRRRDLLRHGALLPLAAAPVLRPLALAAADAPAASGATPGTAFDGSTVRALARGLAAKPYQAPSDKLPDPLAKLNYDQYRMIRFDPARSLWRGKGLPFEVQLFHRGFLYPGRVELYEVVGGKAEAIRYSPDMFDFGTLPRPPGGDDLGFAGFRIHAPLNRADYFDEICAFLGASYFRAVAKGQGYGLSARGLAIKTGDPGGEEFPVFRAFWIERPPPRAGSIVVHALLDGPSAAGAFRFTIRPGEETVFDVESAIYPRVDITEVGLAPLTSMFYFGPSSRAGIDDYRPAVHDSDGLQMWTGWSEQLWRPLTNPVDLQISTFSDINPRGFGLMQRRRDFTAYQDLESHFEKRPSLWVETIGDAGEGAVHLIEIPTKHEIHDNIVAFWRPTQPLHAKGEYNFNYRLHWCTDHNPGNNLARIVDTRSGAGSAEKTRLFVIDFAGDRLKALPADAKPSAEVKSDKGKIANVVAQPNPETGGWRVSFELAPDGEATVEMRAQLLSGDAAVTEAWIYRWTR